MPYVNCQHASPRELLRQTAEPRLGKVRYSTLYELLVVRNLGCHCTGERW